jgi:uncharacterized membrane protein YkvA (DUF1232 family)
LGIALRALRKAKAAPRKFGMLWTDLHALARLVSAWARREYTIVPWRAIAMSTAALLYFVNPFDAIPDAILGFGYLDDASVLAFVAGAIKRDLERFAEWEALRQSPVSRR